MIIVVGLGNPGEKYKENRHNVGFMVLDRLAQKKWAKSKSGLFEYCWNTPELALVKPLTFMNESGKAVSSVYKKHNLAPGDLYVIYDDLDLRLGSYKIQKGKGPHQHNGINSIYETINTTDFWHVRIGVDNRTPDARTPGEAYVLQDFTNSEVELLDKTIEEVIEELKNEI